MSFLLDTHIALWALVDDPRLSAAARGYIGDQKADVYVSAASVWEIAIKHALSRRGKNRMPLSGEQALVFFKRAGFTMLPITAKHAASVEDLPPLHTDPFDRLLVSQAIQESLVLITHDAQLSAYHPGIVVV